MNSIQLNVDLTFGQLLEVVKQLSPKEKLILNGAIWDEAMEIPIEQRILVLQRKQDAQDNVDYMLGWDQASKTLTS